MLEHLLNPEFDDLAKLDTPALLEAQASTADWLIKMGSPEHVLREDEKQTARQAFVAVTDPGVGAPATQAALLKLKVPHAVKHLAGMLSQYDWDFVEQAKEIRGYVVAKLLEESKSPDARFRLRSLELLGKVTEVAAFTERSVVTHAQEDHGVIEERLRARLKSLLPPTLEIQDTEVKDIAIVKHTPSKAGS